MKTREHVYTNIEKEINSNENKFSDYLKDSFWRMFYLFNKYEFKFNGKVLSCFYHTYNKTWRNERSIEIPIINQILNKYKDKIILEVGNVLSHYQKTSHEVLDKYEIGPSVINKDIIDFYPQKKYDLIISISTIEHIGWDEIPKDHTKTLKGINHMLDLLSPNGAIYITIPMGYNTDLENLITEGKIKFSEVYYMKRIPPKNKKYPKFIYDSPSYHNKWIEVPESEIKQIKYGSPYPHANALLIGKIVK